MATDSFDDEDAWFEVLAEEPRPETTSLLSSDARSPIGWLSSDACMPSQPPVCGLLTSYASKPSRTPTPARSSVAPLSILAPPGLSLAGLGSATDATANAVVDVSAAGTVAGTPQSLDDFMLSLQPGFQQPAHSSEISGQAEFDNLGAPGRPLPARASCAYAGGPCGSPSSDAGGCSPSTLPGTFEVKLSLKEANLQQYPRVGNKAANAILRQLRGENSTADRHWFTKEVIDLTDSTLLEWRGYLSHHAEDKRKQIIGPGVILFFVCVLATYH
jgi:hypothetical protein